jgi:hypothetical protein
MTKLFNNILSAALLTLGALPVLALSQAQAATWF